MPVKLQRGMTLLEVMVALVVFAIGCLAVMHTTGQQIRGLTTLEKKMVAGWVADNQLALLTLSHQRPSALWQQGREDMAGQQWFWRYRSRQTTTPGLYAVDIDVADEPAFTHPDAQIRTCMR